MMRVLDVTRRTGARAIAAVLVGAAATVTVAMLMSGGSAVGAPTCTMNFTATAGGSFLTAANWDVNRLPATTDYACIPATITGAVTYSGTSTIGGIKAQGAGGFIASSGTLTLSDTTNASAIKALTLSGASITGAANVTLSGPTGLAKGSISGTGTATFSHGATMTVTGFGNSNDVHLSRPMTNDGTILIAAGDRLLVDSPAVLTNAADGKINLDGDSTTLNGSGGSVDNSAGGLITAGAGSGTATIYLPVTTALNHLTIAAGTGTLSLRGGGSYTGTETVPSGTTLSFDAGTYNFDTVTINGPGVTHLTNTAWALTNGTTTIASPLSMFNSGINGVGNLVIAAPSSWQKSGMSGTGTVTLNAGVTMTVLGFGNSDDVSVSRSFTNHGTILLPAGKRLLVNSPAVLTNAADGTINLDGDTTSLAASQGATGATVDNSAGGLITAGAGSGTATIFLPVTTALNHLTIAAGTGALSLRGGGSFTGTETVPSGTTLSFDAGTYNFDTVTINGPGVTHLTNTAWALTNGTTTIASPLSMFNSGVGGVGNLVIATPSTWQKSSMSGTGTVTLNNGVTMTVLGFGNSDDVNVFRPFTNHGTILIPTGDRLLVNSPAVLTNAADGTINLDGDNTSLSATQGATDATIDNKGLITRSAGTGTATIFNPVSNETTGVIDLGTGTLSMRGGLTNAATVNVGFQTLNVTGGMTSASKGILEIGVGSASHGSVTAASTDKLGGELHINLQSGYTPTVGTAVQLITTTGTQSGAFKVGAYQIIGATNDGWKFKTSANKVVATVRPLSDVSPAITNVPALATQTIPFNFDIKVTNNGPNPANAAAVTLSFPASLHVVSGTLPAGCTQPTATKVHCSAGTLAVSATATFTITLVGSAAATDTLTVAASTANTDIVATNNKASATVSVV